MRLILDRSAQELRAEALADSHSSHRRDRLGGWFERLRRAIRAVHKPIHPSTNAAPNPIAFSELVYFHERQTALPASAVAPNWTELLGLPSLPADEAKRIELVELAAILERYDILEAAAETDPGAGVRASARRALPLVPT